MNHPRSEPSPALLVIGSGDRDYRGYALQALAKQCRVILIDSTVPTWQRPYIAGHLVADLRDQEAVLAAAETASANFRVEGVLTWHEFAAVHAATTARGLGVPGSEPAGVRACRNKAAARAIFDAHGVASARWAPVSDLADVRIAAHDLGYPFVLKPASAAGSAGVIRIDRPADLHEALAFAAAAAAGQSQEAQGMLAEEYLDGPEVSVEVVSHQGHHTTVAVTRKQLGAPPYFEETGHLVSPALDGPETDEAAHVATQALDALDITHGISHVELRLTRSGPRIVEVNPRLGGDLIPHLVNLATGIDLIRAAADLALGRVPDVRPKRHASAAIGFLYPTSAGQLRSLTVDPSLAAHTWCERAVLEQQPGASVAPPPGSGLDSRLAPTSW
ncbi:acetyl-CoA carboxylase biotin carboxylase subunit family protein [Streptomyces sp. NPDC001933]|uniref:ATP-grasp domain-containing protein n=1 Tax=Streptomyces sp. NPDC001933 TaxID=3364626 RepID=UPI003686033B